MNRHKSEPEVSADMMDVHVLDIIGHIEALLRSAREVQRSVLRVRGVPSSLSLAEQEHAAAAVRQRLVVMLKECDSAKEAVHEASLSAANLRPLA